MSEHYVLHCAKCGMGFSPYGANAWRCSTCERQQPKDETLPCGHPTACIVGSAGDTHYCGWCASVAQATGEERERCAAQEPDPEYIREVHLDSFSLAEQQIADGFEEGYATGWSDYQNAIRVLADKEEPK